MTGGALLITSHANEHQKNDYHLSEHSTQYSRLIHFNVLLTGFLACANQNWFRMEQHVKMYYCNLQFLTPVISAVQLFSLFWAMGWFWWSVTAGGRRWLALSCCASTWLWSTSSAASVFTRSLSCPPSTTHGWGKTSHAFTTASAVTFSACAACSPSLPSASSGTWRPAAACCMVSGTGADWLQAVQGLRLFKTSTDDELKGKDRRVLILNSYFPNDPHF